MSRRIITVIVLVAASTAAAVPHPVQRVRPAVATASPVPDQGPVIEPVDLRTVRAVSRSMVRTAPPKVIKKVVIPKIVIKKKVVQKQPTVVTVPATGVRALGQRMAAAAGWTGQQWQCMNSLIARESGWRVSARNPSLAPTGCPRLFQGAAWGRAGRLTRWCRSDFFLRYVKSRYGTPCGAWAHSQSSGWY